MAFHIIKSALDGTHHQHSHQSLMRNNLGLNRSQQGNGVILLKCAYFLYNLFIVLVIPSSLTVSQLCIGQCIVAAVIQANEISNQLYIIFKYINIFINVPYILIIFTHIYIYIYSVCLSIERTQERQIRLSGLPACQECA